MGDIMKVGLLGLQRFLQRFIDPSSTEDENAGLDLNEPLYMQKLEEVLLSFLSRSSALICSPWGTR